MYFGYDVIYGAVVSVITGLIYWLVRRLVQRKRFGNKFKKIRKAVFFNEIIKTLLFMWFVELICCTQISLYSIIRLLRDGYPIGIYDFINLPPHWEPIPRYWVLEHCLENLVMFVPLGLALPFVLKRENFGKAVLIGFVCTFLTEFLQGFTGRVGGIDDIIFNTLGTAAGYVLYLIMKLIFPKFTEKCKTRVEKYGQIG